MRIIKATDAEKRTYGAKNPVHPLYGWAKIPGYTLMIEYLGEGSGEPTL